MSRDPFATNQGGSDIRDNHVDVFAYEVNGDIMAEDLYQKRPFSKKFARKSSMLLVFVVSTFFVVLFGKLYYLQMVRGAEYYGTAEGNRIRSIAITPPRGVIFDNQFRRLAYNVPDFSLVVTPADLPSTQEEEDAIFKSIEEIIGINAFDIVESFSDIPRNSYVPVEIIRGIPSQAAIVLSKESGNWSGVSLVPTQQRAYTFDFPFSHVLGYTGKISQNDYDAYVAKEGYTLVERIGKTGIEKTYQSKLRGIPGVELVEVDSRGKHTRELSTKPAIPGESVYLHIDAALQQVAYDALKESIEKQESPGGSVIVVDPRNGAVRALVSYPSFSSEEFSRGIGNDAYQNLLTDPRQPLFNRTISGEYPSGSTIKLVIGAAGLEEGTVNRHTTVQSTGGVRINEYWYPDWKYGGHGTTDIVRALAESVNTYFYAIGGGHQSIEGLGVDRIVAYAKRFGLNSISTIDLPSEQSGFLPSKEWKEEAKGERWYLGDTYHLAIGQGDLLVTPLQVANFTAVIANGGTLYAPRIVDRIGRNYQSALPFTPVILENRVASPENIKIIQEGLRAAVTYGTARSLLTLPVSVAGKTGTAQFGQDKNPHAWFTGYGPYDNPEIVVTVLVEEGKGGDIAGTPVAKKIFEWYFRDK
ncbi:penicillin-binding protein 2 [bacterium CG10_46_32]|nr:MAG: penicillin-binding protein 2 [bacterium CG10_46_32]PIR55962.1 MAG: penicillin-binding protein 2 [Parcubacteria group bacterium CG10_big_fil_rev_8_21_14_0_10_46_32]